MLTLNKNYNPNDPNSKRWVTSTPTYTSPLSNIKPVSFSELFKPIVQPFKDAVKNPQPIIKTNTPNMSVAPARPNMSIAPVYPKPSGQSPTVEVQKTTPNPVVPSQPGAKTTVNIPAPVAQKPNVPLTATGEIDYNKLAIEAGKAGVSVQDYLGLVQGQATPGTKEMEDIYTKLGIPDLVTQVYTKPAKTTQSIYEDYYNQSGLGDIKAKVASLDTELKTIRDGYTTAIKEHQDNPWLSATTRSAKIAREKELYGQREANAISLRQSYLDQYNLGVGEIEKTVGRVAGDLEYDRTLSADKLNYLLGEAERKAGLAVTDATKQGLRYAGSYLTSRRNEKIAEETRAFNRQVELKKLESGSDIASAISKLSTTSPTAGGYFSALNNVLAIKDSTPEKSKLALKTLTGYLQDGNEGQAREYLQQLALGSLSGTDRSDAMKRTQSINAINAIKDKLNAYVEKYGDTNILKGSFQNIQQSLGTAGNPDAAKLNNELTTLLQQARVNVTGAAWGKQETKEYEKINANLKNTNRLNMAILDSNLDILNRNNASAIQWVIGKDTYDQLYKPTAGVGGVSASLPSVYAKADKNTKAAIDKMVADGLPEATILQIIQ